MDLYCWAGVAILLIILGVSVFCLWSKSGTHDDDIQYLKDQGEAARKSAAEDFGSVNSQLRKVEVRFIEDLQKVRTDCDADILLHDESIGILEKRVADVEESTSNVRDHERRIDAHEKRLNDQMSHILNDEKKLAVLGARVDGQDAVTQVALEAFDVVAEVYKAALAAGTFTVVDEQVSSRGRKPREKGKRVA